MRSRDVAVLPQLTTHRLLPDVTAGETDLADQILPVT